MCQIGDMIAVLAAASNDDGEDDVSAAVVGRAMVLAASSRGNAETIVVAFGENLSKETEFYRHDRETLQNR